MDIGRSKAIFSSNPDLENSLNEENWQKSLEVSKPVDLPAPEKFEETETPVITSEIASSVPETPAKAPEAIPIASSLERPASSEKPLALGQIVSMSPEINQAVTRVNYNPANIRTTGDRLEKTTLFEVNKVVEKLSQTGDLNNFYEEIRGEDGMLEANLNNSFNRKLYGEDDKGGMR